MGTFVKRTDTHHRCGRRRMAYWISISGGSRWENRASGALSTKSIVARCRGCQIYQTLGRVKIPELRRKISQIWPSKYPNRVMSSFIEVCPEKRFVTGSRLPLQGPRSPYCWWPLFWTQNGGHFGLKMAAIFAQHWPPFWIQDGGHLEFDDVTTYAN